MKKKFLLTFAIATVLFCFFAIGASAVQIYDDFDVTALENIEYRADDVIVFDDGFSCPSVYVFKDTKSIGKGQWSSPDGLKSALDFTYINQKVKENTAEGETPKVYGFDDIDSIDIPQGVISMGQYACNSLSTIRAISLPDTLVSFGGTCFQNATGLEYCIMEHGEDSTLTTLPGTMFSGSGLKAFSMPDCITILEKGNEFGNCKSLTALYLSKNLTAIIGTSGKTSSFDGCEKMYFVNEPFVATSESQTPAKPSVYYFPSNLATLGKSDIGVFRSCRSINDVLVFGEKLTAITNRVTFQNSPANTIVFLGDMTDVVASETYNWGTKNLIFANPLDKSASDLNTLALKSGTTTAYFCYGENAKHIKELTTTKEATCTLPAMTADFCFCGKPVPNTETTVGDALGHSHTIYLGVVYESYMAKGYKEYECERCGDVNVDEKTPALFVCLGYSTQMFGNSSGIAIGYTANTDAIAEYTEETGTTLTYGVFAVSKEKLGENEVFAEDGTAASGVICVEISSKEFSAFELTIVGFTDGYKTAKLALGAYVKVTKGDTTEYSYMQDATKGALDGKYYFASYNDVIGIN